MFSLIRVWLSDCLEGHSLCSKSVLPEAQTSIVPTRLIDVGSSASARKPRLVKFRDVSELPSATRSARYPGYAVLSYCWGKDREVGFVPREENEAEFLRGFPLVSLPRSVDML